MSQRNDHEWRERALGDQPPYARPDFDREARKGIPEIILAGPKTDEQVVTIARAFLERSGRAILTRLRVGTLERLPIEFGDCAVDIRHEARAAAIHAPGYTRPVRGGRIGILTAGTSDIPVAEEARLIAEEMGCSVATLYDVGVAGLHRLLEPLRELLASDVAALVVCAGMDGALPSVVAGLAPVPVIGVPTPVGYGAGGKGRAALLAMLQTCAPGMTVVNVGNGVGAGATAALIANRVAAAACGEAPRQPSQSARRPSPTQAGCHGHKQAPRSDKKSRPVMARILLGDYVTRPLGREDEGDGCVRALGGVTGSSNGDTRTAAIQVREVRKMATSKRGPEPGSDKAKHGGQAVREKYGPEFYSRIGKKGGEAVKTKLGSAFYAEIGKKGGESTKRQQGPEFYSRIGKKGGERGRGTPKTSARDRE